MRERWWVMWPAVLMSCGSAAPTPAPPPTAPAGEALLTPPPAPAAPVRAPVPGLAGVVSLSVGEEHACVALAEGEVRCWGSGGMMRLGNGRLEAVTSPARVLGVDPARVVGAGGGMGCALERDGEVWCWGGWRRIPDDPDGLLEAADARPVLVATPVVGVRAMAIGWNQVTLLDGGGRLQIMDAYAGMVPLDAFAPAVEVAAFSRGLCARDAAGGVECVGDGDAGETGNAGGPGGWGEEPARVLAPVVWSDALEAELGWSEDDPREPPCTPVEEGDDPRPAYCDTPMRGAVDLDAHERLACVALADGRVACWGCADCWGDARPPLGIGDGPTVLPRIVPGIDDAKAVAVGGRHVCYLSRANVTRCWGDNFEGQLGDPRATASATPVEVRGLGEVVALDAGAATTCALRADRTVVCWGRPLGTPGKERPDPDAAPATPWTELPTYTREAPAESEPAAPRVCRDVDLFRRDDPLESVTYTYDAKGRVTRAATRVERDDGPHDQTITYTYDRAGNVASEKGRNTIDDTLKRFERDAKGRVTKETGSWRGPVRWRWVIDGDAELGTSTDYRQVRIERDAAGREVRRRIADGDAREASEIEAVRDEAGRVTLVRETAFPFPFFDHPLDVWETRVAYDAAGRKVRSERLRRAPDGSWVPWRTTAHLYTGCRARTR